MKTKVQEVEPRADVKWKALPEKALESSGGTALIDPDGDGKDGWGVMEIPIRLPRTGDERLGNIPCVGEASVTRWTEIMAGMDGKVYEGAFFAAGEVAAGPVHREIGDQEARDFLLKHSPFIARLFGAQPPRRVDDKPTAPAPVLTPAGQHSVACGECAEKDARIDVLRDVLAKLCGDRSVGGGLSKYDKAWWRQEASKGLQ